MTDLLFRLGVAVSIGLLVGLERGWRERTAASGSRTAGIRTYAISGLLGGILMAIEPPPATPWVFIAGFVAFSGAFGAFALREGQSDRNFSATGTIAALGVFALGGLAVAGQAQAAAAAGTGLAAVLASREVLHDWLRRITWVELRSAMTLAVMTAVVLPMLPDRAVDPWGGLNPREIWLFTVLTATISYVGYILVRVAGPSRGLILSSLAGGLVSSTALMIALGRQSATGAQSRPLSGGAALAAMVSVLRVTAIVLIVSPAVCRIIAPVTVSAALVFGLGGSLLILRRDRPKQAASGPQNPFQLLPLLGFATFFAAVSMLNAALSPALGERGLVASAALSGLLDVDVAILTSLRMPVPEVAQSDIALAVLGGLAANGFGRLGMAVLSGRPGFWLPLAAVTVAAVGCGALISAWLGLI